MFLSIESIYIHIFTHYETGKVYHYSSCASLLLPSLSYSSPPTHIPTAIRILQGPHNKNWKNRVYSSQVMPRNGIPQSKPLHHSASFKVRRIRWVQLEKYTLWHREDILNQDFQSGLFKTFRTIFLKWK